ncbi:GNAT family N-acetyltransferase [Anthocerotibacter panamensis]|uniref:GNAT family N-acetyltransferase n=1 Tax=Anthocerotibacter panamensis TaxID=2857077 RepID=UPI001C404A3F|nr:GNAT family N-acetyltransferase [Anthocerotibacter panamensis]
MLTLRPAAPHDIPLILAFIRELATYERLAHEVKATEELLQESLFAAPSTVEVILAFYGEEPAGFAVVFPNFSTFLGRPGLYLEDLYVRPHLRGCGIGRALLTHLARLTQERGYGRLEWAALNWNEPALAFYRHLGATPLDDWIGFRLTGEALAQLAQAE